MKTNVQSLATGEGGVPMAHGLTNVISTPPGHVINSSRLLLPLTFVWHLKLLRTMPIHYPLAIPQSALLGECGWGLKETGMGERAAPESKQGDQMPWEDHPGSPSNEQDHLPQYHNVTAQACGMGTTSNAKQRFPSLWFVSITE